MLVMAQPAGAQSLLGALFGLGQPPSRAVSQPRAMSAPPRPERERDVVVRSEREPSNTSSADKHGQVQTMCVRTCDGYYWPLHFPVGKGELGREAALCQATCDSATKLYTRADPGTEAEEMVDADGTSYGSSPTAFAYRKHLIDGCTCRPMPWSDGEMARHEAYALAAQEKKLRAELAEAERLVAASTPQQSQSGETVAPLVVAAAEHAEDMVEGGPPLGPLEAALLSTRQERATDSSGDRTAAPAAEPGAAARAARPAVNAAAERRRRAAPAEVAVRTTRSQRRVRLAQQSAPHHSGGAFNLFSGAGKYTYPGDPPGR